jgi:hypothetical protein
MQTGTYTDQLNQAYFGGRLSSAFLEGIAGLPVDRADVRCFVKRMFRLMKRGRFDETHLSQLQAEVLGTLLARILPGGWEGRIPPITLAGRHKTTDRYIVQNPWLDTKRSGTILDLGCGLPPDTTVELASSLPHWSVLGADPSLPVHVLYDNNENYASFDEHGSAYYFQPAVPTVENWNELLEDSGATRDRFERLLQESLTSANQATVGTRLIPNPVRDYEKRNLSFLRGGIGKLDIEPVDIIRCFNVLYYFDNDFRQQALCWFKENLRDGGLLLIGGDWALSTEARYYTYQKINDRLRAREFAFSIDNLCPLGIMTWYTNHDDDEEVGFLSELLGIIRSDRDFVSSFYRKSDALRAQYGICARGDDGFYGAVAPSISPLDLWSHAARIADELAMSPFASAAVDILNAAGYAARQNEVGHIAINLDNTALDSEVAIKILPQDQDLTK